MVRRMTLAAVGAIALVAGLGFPTTANAQSAAGTARVHNSNVKFQAAPDQVNEVSIVQVGGDVYISDVKPINAGPGCWYPYQGDNTTVACNKAPNGVQARLGDRSDLLYMDVSGGDRAWGQKGHDTMEGTGYDRLYGGDGNDSLYTARWQYGGNGRDWLIGSGRYNRLEGGNSHDNIFGLDGLDDMFGGPGNDYLSGGMGYDYMKGGDGEDLMYGDRGNDRMYGGAHSDSLYGGSGSDLVRGGSGSDYVYGGPGSDRTYQN